MNGIITAAAAAVNGTQHAEIVSFIIHSGS